MLKAASLMVFIAVSVGGVESPASPASGDSELASRITVCAAGDFEGAREVCAVGRRLAAEQACTRPDDCSAVGLWRSTFGRGEPRWADGSRPGRRP